MPILGVDEWLVFGCPWVALAVGILAKGQPSVNQPLSPAVPEAVRINPRGTCLRPCSTWGHPDPRPSKLLKPRKSVTNFEGHLSLDNIIQHTQEVSHDGLRREPLSHQ